MSPAVDSSAREALEPTDEPTIFVPVVAEDIQSDKVTQPSDDTPVTEDAGGTQCSLLKDGNSDTKLEDGIDSDNSFRPPPLPGVIPEDPISQPVTGGSGLKSVKHDNMPQSSTAERDTVSKEDKDSEEQQTQDESDDPLRPPIPPSLVYKGRPLGPTAGGGSPKTRPKPGPKPPPKPAPKPVPGQ
ncbi:hypothetical protein EV421DRAFT_1731068 [Armillaria borealis]|uniref:Uncharacterized protein n=1 Tax=Armillaria borealis TaxID=47425 RepID=A0AA39N095_9AGAR|nr:hypothetical protein EV421DRAFT_1731068 [Armillaria borealis]